MNKLPWGPGVKQTRRMMIPKMIFRITTAITMIVMPATFLGPGQKKQI